MPRRNLCRTVLFVMGGILLARDIASGQAITFRKISDTDASVPGRTGTFSSFERAPALSGGNVAFLGTDSSGNLGIYIDVSGVLVVVADTNTSIPGGSESFISFSHASLSGTDVAFYGAGSTEVGIYARIGGTLDVVADTNTAVPGGSGNFTDFDTNAPSIDGGNVAFVASSTSWRDGLYTDIGGTLSVVANSSTAMPGGAGTFSSFDTVSLDGGDVAFRGFGSGKLGIYTEISGTLDLVADTNTAIPGGTGNFTSFGSASISSGKVALRAGVHPHLGIYTDAGGLLDVVADTNTPVPRGTGNFLFQGGVAPSIQGQDIAFEAGASSFSSGIYARMQGSLLSVVDYNVSLDGKTQSWVEAGPQALSGQDIVFHMVFSDNSEGIYVATVPLGVCGNGILEQGEECDEGGEWTACDADCTFAVCGDGTVNTTAGEECDDAGESTICDDNCTLAVCGDGTLNTTAGEQCDAGGESAACDADCTPAACGDGTVNTTAGEECDDAGESMSCDADCTLAVCGDGMLNTTAGEECDDGGESAACDVDCTPANCGDGTLNSTAGEECDDAGESAACDDDCTLAVCGDGTVNTTAGEQCDDGGESAACDADCTPVACGDATVNTTAGEECDDGNSENGDGCSAQCESEGGVTPGIPTISHWGLAAMTLLLLAGGKAYFRRRRFVRTST